MSVFAGICTQIAYELRQQYTLGFLCNRRKRKEMAPGVRVTLAESAYDVLNTLNELCKRIRLADKTTPTSFVPAQSVLRTSKLLKKQVHKDTSLSPWTPTN